MDDYLFISDQPEPIGAFTEEDRLRAVALLGDGYLPALKGYIQRQGKPPSVTTDEVYWAMLAILKERG